MYVTVYVFKFGLFALCVLLLLSACTKAEDSGQSVSPNSSSLVDRPEEPEKGTASMVRRLKEINDRIASAESTESPQSVTLSKEAQSLRKAIVARENSDGIAAEFRTDAVPYSVRWTIAASDIGEVHVCLMNHRRNRRAVPRSLAEVGSGEFASQLDPWGRQYCYATRGESEYRIWSKGELESDESDDVFYDSAYGWSKAPY